MMNGKSHLTAISRKTLPLPVRWLVKNFRLVRRNPVNMLDYGCGKCHEINNEYFGQCDGYDPYYRPDGLIKGKRYDYILCTYVLCTIDDHEERLKILKEIKRLLKPDGHAYISVRNDKPKKGWGVTSIGTYQGRVQDLPLTLFQSCSQFRIYVLTKQTKLR